MPTRKNLAPLMTPDEVAELLRLARKTIVTMARERRLPSIRIGRTLRFDREEIDRWVRNQRS